MEYNYEDYVTFHTKAADGSEVEMAIVDEFDFEHKHYVVAAMVKEDTIEEEGYYIYRSYIGEDDFRIEKITNAVNYNKIAEAYLAMQEETE